MEAVVPEARTGMNLEPLGWPLDNNGDPVSLPLGDSLPQPLLFHPVGLRNFLSLGVSQQGVRWRDKGREEDNGSCEP